MRRAACDHQEDDGKDERGGTHADPGIVPPKHSASISMNSMPTKALTDMFVLTLPVAEKMIRPVIVYVFLIVGLRMAGKREMAQLNPFDLVVLLTLSNTVQNAIIGEDNSVTGGILGAATLLVVNYLVVRFLYNHEKLDRLIEGEPDVLIENGVIQMDRLKKEFVTLTELEAAAHKQGFESLDSIERAVLDPGGTVSFVARRPSSDDTRHTELLARLDAMAAQIAALKGAR
jgi:uncharacterized membrane protein YcaP (DUF421 family)